MRPFVGRMSLQQIAGVLEGLLAALSQAEAMGIVHRDVKPENLLVTWDGGIKIADFGIAKAVQQVQTEELLTPAGATVGTPAYMAPEQAMAGEIGPWTDLYQTGVVAYELLTGAVPFRAEGAPIAVLMKHMTDPVPDLPPGTDPALAAWVQRLMAKEPAGRPRGARAAWNELEEIIVAAAGPLWRREARLGEHEPTVEHPTPLTPARFSSWQDYVPEPARRPSASTPPTPAPPTPPRREPAIPPPPDVVAPPAIEPETPVPPAETPSLAPRETAPVPRSDALPPPVDSSAATVAPVSQPVASERPRRRTPVVPIAAVGLLAAAAIAAILVFGNGGDGGDPTPTATTTATRTATATATATAAATPPAGPFPVGERPDGVALGAGAVWAVGGRDGVLTRIDPKSGETTSVEVGKNPDSVVVAFDSAWVSVTDENKVVRVSTDPQPAVIDTFDVGARPEGIAASSQAIWVANAGDGTLSQIVEATGDVRTAENVAGEPVGLAIGAGAVWVADAEGRSVARVDGGGRKLVTTVSGIGPNPRAVAIVGRQVWVATAGDGRVWVIDADSNRVAGSVRVGGQPRDITTDGKHLFVTDREGGRVVEVDPDARDVVNRETVGGGPLSVAADARDVWVTRFDAGDVARIAR